jgi:nitrite reductase/ring-hydroxylating ferredoxin subunit
MLKKRICKISQIEEKNYFITWVKELRDEIIVFKNNNKIYIKSSICPHFGGTISYDSTQKNLFCYWHGLKFSIEGKCINNKNFKSCLNSYNFEIKGNYIYIVHENS